MRTISLTPRQVEIARLVFHHKTQREMAEELRLGVKGIKFHLTNIYALCGVDGHLGLLKLFYRLNIKTAQDITAENLIGHNPPRISQNKRQNSCLNLQSYSSQ